MKRKRLEKNVQKNVKEELGGKEKEYGKEEKIKEESELGTILKTEQE